MELIASIIIPTFNRNEIANVCINSVVACNLNNIEIIVVNDSKENKFVLSVNNNKNYVQVIDNPGKGVASARNYGAKQARSPKLIFVDDDMILNSEAIQKAIEFLNANTKATYNANWTYEKQLIEKISETQFGRYLINSNYTTLKGWNEGSIKWDENSLIEANGITSQFFAITKQNFELIGGYNEKFPFAGFEDYEFYANMKTKGIINYIDTTVMIYHNEIDRVNVQNWLERKKRGAITRKVAVQMGFKELEIKYNTFKKIILTVISQIKPIIHLFYKIIPSLKLFDSIYSKIINLLIAVYIFDGYQSKNAN